LSQGTAIEEGGGEGRGGGGEEEEEEENGITFKNSVRAAQ